jgi:hypothetical protein
MKCFLLTAIFVVLPCANFAASSTPEYSIQAIRYASAEDDVATRNGTKRQTGLPDVVNFGSERSGGA